MPLTDLPEPPPPPSTRRHVRLYRYQWVGLVLLASLPALALAGVFGETWRVEKASAGSVEVTVRYPDRYRYKQLNSVEVWVRNASPAVFDTVTVAIDTAFGNRFSTVRAIPSFAQPYEAELVALAPGETRMVVIELQGERYGRHVGRLTVAAADTVDIPLSIRIFP